MTAQLKPLIAALFFLPALASAQIEANKAHAAVPEITPDKPVPRLGGIGAVIDVSKDSGRKIIFTQILSDSPAARAGLLPGDVIIKIDRASTKNATISRVADLLLGPPDTNVSVTITRDGLDSPKMFTMRRKVIQLRPVSSR